MCDRRLHGVSIVQLLLGSVLQGQGEPSSSLPRSIKPCELRVRLRCVGCGLQRWHSRACAALCVGCPKKPGPRAAAITSVLPSVPLRHWVLTPHAQAQAALRGDPALARWLGRCFVREISRALHGERGHTGAVSVVHFSTQSLEPTLHLHAITIDGVYVDARDGPRFRPTAQPIDERVTAVIARRVGQALRQRVTPAPRSAAKRSRAPAGTPIVDRSKSTGRDPSAAARVAGARVRVTDAIAADDRPARVRLARYLTRPWIDGDRIALAGEDEAVLSLARAHRDGVAAVRLSTAALQDRIVAALPGSHAHPIAFHGVLAPRAALRRAVIPGQLPLWPAPDRPPRRITKRQTCPRCGQPMIVEHLALALDDHQCPSSSAVCAPGRATSASRGPANG